MTSIDELFRKPYTSESKKRKATDPTSTFSSSNKAARTTHSTSPHTNGSSSSTTYAGGIPKIASVEDEPEVENVDDIEAGPALPSNLEDDEPDDDEDGRFFGGGVSKQEREVLDYIDAAEEVGDGTVPDEKIDAAWLRRIALSFEKKISKNAEQRVRYADQPEKFMSSEADLDSEIKGLSILAEHPALYEEFVRLGCVGSLVGLLSHENTDVAISVVEVLGELTDEDGEAAENEWQALVKGLVEADVVGLLVQNLARLDEDREEDREGVYHVLEVLENLLTDNTTLSDQPELISWLAKRITQRKPDKQVSQNQQYAAELLSTLLQTTGLTNQTSFLSQNNGIDSLLQLLSAYRRIDPPQNTDEEEWAANLFASLTCLVDTARGSTDFLAGEGVELALIMLREGKTMSRSRSLVVLDHACSGPEGVAVCERLVDAAGLKTLFGMFMMNKKNNNHHNQRGGAITETTEHLVGIFASLLRHLPADSAPRIRVLAKFVEQDYAKIDRLIVLRATYDARVRVVNEEIRRERDAVNHRLGEAEVEEDESETEREDRWLARQLDAGLFTLRTLDIVLAWLVAEDDGARRRISSASLENSSSGGGGKEVKQGGEQAEGVDVLKRSLSEVRSGITLEDDDDPTTAAAAAARSTKVPETETERDEKVRAREERDMLDALIACL